MGLTARNKKMKGELDYMNYMLYGKHKDDKHFGAMNLSDGSIGVGLIFATLIPDIERAKKYTDELMANCPDFTFQVREAGKSKVVYAPERRLSA